MPPRKFFGNNTETHTSHKMCKLQIHSTICSHVRSSHRGSKITDQRSCTINLIPIHANCLHVWVIHWLFSSLCDTWMWSQSGRRNRHVRLLHDQMFKTRRHYWLCRRHLHLAEEQRNDVASKQMSECDAHSLNIRWNKTTQFIVVTAEKNLGKLALIIHHEWPPSQQPQREGEARRRARLARMMLQLANKHTGAEPRVCQPKRLTAARYLSVATKMSRRIRGNPTN